GRTAITDAFFPLLWLHWGDWENLLMGTQIQVILPAALVCASLAVLTRDTAPPSPWRAAFVGACTLILPLNGGFGLCQRPGLAAWLAIGGVARLASATDRRGRLAAATMLLFAVAGVVLVRFYFVDFFWPQGAPPERDPFRAFLIFLQTLSMNLG